MTSLTFDSTPSTSGTSGGSTDKEFPLVPNNEVVAVEVARVQHRALDEEFRRKYNVKDTHKVSFAFKVLEGPGKGKWLWADAKPYFNSSDNCRLRIWVEAILGVDGLPDGFSLDFDENDGRCRDLEGLEARVLVQHRQAKAGTPDEKTVEKITQVLRSATQVEADEEYEAF